MKRIALWVLPLTALIFELLPSGVVLRFANPDGDPWVRTYCHFDLTPFGYANFGPLIAAVAAFAPVMFGLEYLTVIGIVVGLLLAATFGACLIKEKQ